MSEVAGFGVKAKEAITFLKGKLPEASLAWDDLAGPVHAKVFTVAGASTTAIASELHKAMVSAIDNGTTITEFRKQFDATVAKHGWTYNGKRGWRTQVIFDANMRSAHMAGRWQQLWAGRDRRPFLEYRTAGDTRVRPQHRQWNGIVRAITDAFWATFYPPNGWGCRCTVRARTQAEVDAKGLIVDTEPFQIKTRTVTKAGEPVDRVPVGVDPGWDHNVGASWIAPEVALGRKLLSLPPELRDNMVGKSISPAFQEALKARWNDFQTAFKGASAPPAAAAQIIGFLDGPTIKGVQAQIPEGIVRSTAVAVPGDVMESLAWPAALLDDLPIHLRNYRAVLWDDTAKQLVIVPADVSKLKGRLKGRVSHTIHVEPATTGPARGALAVVATRLTSDADLRNFTVLSGRLE